MLLDIAGNTIILKVTVQSKLWLLVRSVKDEVTQRIFHISFSFYLENF